MTERALTMPVSRSLFLGTCFAVITVAPLTMIHSQWLTGTLVNAMLILTCVLVGPMEAVLIGVLPSTTALMSGLLPIPLAPMIPFIIMGNGIFVAAFEYLRRWNAPAALAAAALAKFLFLAATSRFLMESFIAPPALSRLAVMMGLPQLFTALIGGAIALALLSLLPKRD
jgi:hypothetical protein